MGRGQTATAGTTRFDAIFGSRRGHGISDISGQTLTPAGQAKVEHILKMIGEEDTAAILPDLYHCQQYLGDLSAHPHIERIIDALAGEAVRREEERGDLATRIMLRMSGAVPDGPSNMLTTPSPAARHLVRRLSNQGGRRDTLHIWPDGHKIKGDRDPASAIPMYSKTLCGKDMTGSIWKRAECGAWQRARNTNVDKTCEQCTKLNRENHFSDTEEDEDAPFFSIPLTASTHERSVELISADIVHAIHAHQGHEELHEAVSDSMRRATTETVAQMCLERGGWTLHNLFSSDDSIALSELDGQELTYDSQDRWAGLLTSADWHEALQPPYSAEKISIGVNLQLRLKILASRA